MFKNLKFFRLPSGLAIPSDLDARLESASSRPLSAVEESGAGWARVDPVRWSATVNGATLVALEVSRKPIPADVLKRRVADKVKRLAGELGKWPTKPEREAIKDAERAELIARIPARVKTIRAYLDTAAGAGRAAGAVGRQRPRTAGRAAHCVRVAVVTPVATVATYSAEVQGERYCGWIARTDTGSWSGCIVGDDTAGQLRALQPIAETHEACIVRTNSAEIVSSIASFRQTGLIERDVDVAVSRLLAECDLRPLLQAEPEGMTRDAARALVRGTFAHGARDVVAAIIGRCAARRARVDEILRRVNRQALADALGISVRVVHGWPGRGVGSAHVDAVAELLGLPAALVR